MSKKLTPVPAKAARTPKERFERFVSALIRVPKKEVDEKQREIASRSKKQPAPKSI